MTIMRSNIEQNMKIIADLERLSQEDGFIYTFCGLVLNSLFMSPDEVADIDWNQRLNTQELSFLLGLMVKRPFSLTAPSSPERSDAQFNTAIGLFKELHSAHGFSLAKPAIEIQQNLEDWVAEHVRSYDDWIDSGQGMVEPIFYGGEGAYDFQYLEMAERRYKDDKNWLEHHFGTSFETILDIARQLTQLSTFRVNSTRIGLSFEELCSQYLEIFSFGPEDISDVTGGAIDSFLRAFSLTPGEENQAFDTVGDYNRAHSHPVIRLEHDRFFLPISLNLVESIYESPFYWMLKDSNYKEIALSHRGMATEKIAYELLTQVFGEDNVYRGVKITKRQKDVTDIDVLAIEGSKAVIVQAKSKKLTVASRRGEGECLKKDFQEAVQDAYEQALVSRKAVLEKGNSLLIDGNRIDQVVEAVDEAYIICLTGDHYPAVTTQLESYLQKRESDPYPIAMSIFDLDIVTYYLEDPFDLLYYLRQRSNHATHFKSASEMSFLAFHLRNKLFPMEQDDIFLIGQEYAQHIDAHFPVVKGQYPKTNAENRLFHQWRNEGFEKLVHDVKMMDHPGITDVVFLLCDLAGPGADTLLEGIDKTKQATLRDGELHTVSFPLPRHNRGITFVSYPKTVTHFKENFRGFATARKHEGNADEWLALASRSDSSRSFDAIWYSKDAWRPNSDSDKLAKIYLKPGQAVNVDDRKVGRNAPCPCGSGLKYKRCHGKS